MVSSSLGWVAGVNGQCFGTAARARWAAAVKHPGTKQKAKFQDMQDSRQGRGHGETHWVNFHVGGCCESPSTMIPACTGADAGKCAGIGCVAEAGQISLGIPGKMEGLLLARV